MKIKRLLFVVVAVCSVAFMAVEFLPLRSRISHGPRITSMENLYTIGLARLHYQSDQGCFPARLSDLVPRYIFTNQLEIFYVPAQFTQHLIIPVGCKTNAKAIDEYSAYVYLGTNGAHDVVAFERTNLWTSTVERPDEVAVLFTDGHIQYLSIVRLQELIKQVN